MIQCEPIAVGKRVMHVNEPQVLEVGRGGEWVFWSPVN